MKFHYQLGTVLNSSCDGNDAEDTIFIIASQINHGKEWIVKDKDLSVGIAELNMKAGKRALDGCDFRTANSYLRTGISFLPEDHWKSHYDLSLSLNLLMAGAANSCCQYDEAEQILRGISDKTRCFEDKVPSYYLLSESKCLNLLYLSSVHFEHTFSTFMVVISLQSAGQTSGCLQYLFFRIAPSRRDHSRFGYIRGC